MSWRNGKVDRFRTLRLLVAGLGLLLVARVLQVQVFQHEQYRKLAESQWTKDMTLAADRGNLYDSQGRPLALSVTRWQIGVARSLVKDQDALAGQLAPILGTSPGALKKKFSGDGHVVLAKGIVLSREQKLQLMKLPAVTLEDQRSRIYPYGGVGASLLGFYRHGAQGSVTTGLELGLDELLAGSPGRARKIKSAGQKRDLGQVVLQRPIHGQSAVLSVDADLQAICEQRLGETVRHFSAQGGSVIIVDPATGDILAAASWPLLDSRDGNCADPELWNNRNFTYSFEPGSVFKIFTTASLLRNAAIDTSTVFDCSNGDFGRFRITNDDDHEYGDLPLMRAFSLSSNIYFARAVGNLSNDEFYRDLVDFGFGQKTTLPYPGQAAGILHRPSSWSARSRPTIAIGQEVAVTPLQLAMALGAVANNGTLYAPRLIKEIKNERGETVENLPPVALRRIMSETQAGLLREAMARVVAEGTGTAAQADWIALGGKTGTAQKARGAEGYVPGAYVASFAGLVPVDNPRLVVLTVLDEPRGFRRYYAAQSALPLFLDIVRDIRQSTPWLEDVPGGRTAPLPSREVLAETEVPDVLHLRADKAARTLARAGLKAAGLESEGMVVQQVPAAGSMVVSGQTVQLTLAARPLTEMAAAAVCPDFTGLSSRQAVSLAARLGVALELKGAGYAVAQSPAAGQALTAGRVTLRLEAPWR